MRHPPSSTLFPYTTLFRSLAEDPVRALGDEPAGGRTEVLGEAGGRREDVADVLEGDVPIRQPGRDDRRSEEHTSELQSRGHLVCRLLLEKKKNRKPQVERL